MRNLHNRQGRIEDFLKGVEVQGSLKGRPVGYSSLTRRKMVPLLVRAILAGTTLSFCTEKRFLFYQVMAKRGSDSESQCKVRTAG